MAYNSKFTGAQIDALLDASEAMQTSKEDVANKVTSIGADADDTHYPSAKAVWRVAEKVEGISITSVNLVDSSKNIKSDYFGLYNEAYQTTAYIEISPETHYMLSNNGVSIQARTVKYYAEDKTQLSTEDYVAKFSTPTNAKFVKFAVDNKFTKIQLEEGDAVSPYSEYGAKVFIPDEYISESKLDASLASKITAIGTNSERISALEEFKAEYAEKIVDVTSKVAYQQTFMNLNSILKGGVSYRAEIETENLTTSDNPKDFGFFKVGEPGSFSYFRPITAKIVKNGKTLVDFVLDYDAYAWGVIFNSGLVTSENKTIKVSIYEYHSVKERVEDIEDSLNDDIDGNKIKNGSISSEKVDFIHIGKNIFDEEDPETQVGYFIGTDGGLRAHSSYITSCYIPLEVGKTYTWSGTNIRTGAFYDSNKKFLVAVPENQSSPYTFENTSYSYLRVSVNVNYFYGRNILEEGSEPTGYEKYKKFIDGSLIDIDGLGFAKHQKVWIHVPKRIYVAVGRTIELYYNQVVLNAERYHIQIVCNIGAALDRKWQLTGADGMVGSHNMTINVRDDNDDVIASCQSVVVVTNLSVVSPINVCCVGDSLTNQKPWVNALNTLSNGKFIPVGTRRNGTHEGRSGASSSLYNTIDGRDNLYDFDLYYTGVQVNEAEDFDDSKTYQVGSYCRVFIKNSGGSPSIPLYKYYVFLNEHTGAWSDNDVYCVSGGNPFYDWNNKKFSFNFYETMLLGKSVDVVVIFLGRNGDTADQLKTLVDNIRTDKPNIPIVLINTIFRGTQNGIGMQGNTDGYHATSTYKFASDKHLIELANDLDATFESYENLYICPVGFVHDSTYNYGVSKVRVNPYIDTTDVFEIMPSDSVHPQNSGYSQIADEVFSTLCAITL